VRQARCLLRCLGSRVELFNTVRLTTVPHSPTRFNTATPGGLPYGAEHCVVVRGICKIRGHDQPVCGSPWRHPPCVPIVDLLPHFVGQVQPVQLRRHRALRAPEGRHVGLAGRQARDRRDPERSRVRALRTARPAAAAPARLPGGMPEGDRPISNFGRRRSARGRRAWRDRVASSARRSGRDGRQRGTAADRPPPAPELRRGRPPSGREPLLCRSRRADDEPFYRALGPRPNTVQNQPGGPLTESAMLPKGRILKS
jgi:hypothetical protein